MTNKIQFSKPTYEGFIYMYLTNFLTRVVEVKNELKKAL